MSRIRPGTVSKKLLTIGSQAGIQIAFHFTHLDYIHTGLDCSPVTSLLLF